MTFTTSFTFTLLLPSFQSLGLKTYELDGACHQPAGPSPLPLPGKLQTTFPRISFQLASLGSSNTRQALAKSQEQQAWHREKPFPFQRLVEPAGVAGQKCGQQERAPGYSSHTGAVSRALGGTTVFSCSSTAPGFVAASFSC